MARRREHLRRYVALAVLCTFAIFGAGVTGQSAIQPSPSECIPGGDCDFMPTSARAYAAMCLWEMARRKGTASPTYFQGNRDTITPPAPEQVA